MQNYKQRFNEYVSSHTTASIDVCRHSIAACIDQEYRSADHIHICASAMHNAFLRLKEDVSNESIRELITTNHQQSLLMNIGTLHSDFPRQLKMIKGPSLYSDIVNILLAYMQASSIAEISLMSPNRLDVYNDSAVTIRGVPIPHTRYFHKVNSHLKLLYISNTGANTIKIYLRPDISVSAFYGYEHPAFSGKWFTTRTAGLTPVGASVCTLTKPLLSDLLVICNVLKTLGRYRDERNAR